MLPEATICENKVKMHCSVCALFTETLRKNLHVTGWMKLRKCFQNTKASFHRSLRSHKAYSCLHLFETLNVHMPESFVMYVAVVNEDQFL